MLHNTIQYNTTLRCDYKLNIDADKKEHYNERSVISYGLRAALMQLIALHIDLNVNLSVTIIK